MEKTDAHFKSLFINQVLHEIKFYNTKETFLALDPEPQWVIQGGLEFIFEDKMISFGWNAEMQLNEMIEGDLDTLLGEIDVFDIELEQREIFNQIRGKKIEDISFNWSWYQKMDDELELTDEKIYIPQEIRIQFEDGVILQIASILFQLRLKQLIKPVFDPQGNILISLNKIVEIAES